MSRQFRFYLLPSDIDSLMMKLREQTGLRNLQERASTPVPVELTSAVSKKSIRFHGPDACSVRCFLAETNGDVRMRFIAEQNYWIIDTDSEVIEFSGCDFDGDGVLVSGRFYFQNDVLIGDGIWSKRSEFLKWASRVFRVAKGTMRYSKPLEAYVGKDAELWWRNGGKFAAAVWPGREPAFEKDI